MRIGRSDGGGVEIPFVQGVDVIAAAGKRVRSRETRTRRGVEEDRAGHLAREPRGSDDRGDRGVRPCGEGHNQGGSEEEESHG